MENFIFGGVAAGLAICVVNPIDVVKSRMQMQGELGSSGGRVYTGVLSGLTTIVRREGPKALYKGLAPAILFQMVGNSTRFGVYYAGKEYIGADKTLDSKANFGLAMTAGGLAGVIACPFFTLKTQLQVQSSMAGELAVGYQHAHRGLVDAFRTTVRESGPAGLYAGLPAFLCRCVALVAAQMTTYDWAKQNIRDQKLLVDNTALHVVSSAIAAGAACVCMQPFDLVGARMMNQPTSCGVGTRYASPFDCFIKTIRGEGPAGLYKGVGANYVRMGPQYILTFVFFEKLIESHRGWSR